MLNLPIQPLILIEEARPTRSDAVKNRELLLETAARLFAEHGVDAVSMSAIAQEAGVGKGTLYRHFPSKLQLCHELLDHHQRDLQARALAYFRSGAGAMECLRWFLAAVVEFVHCSEALMFTDLPAGAGTFLGHPAHLWWRQTIRGLLQQIDGVTVDRDYAADTLYIMLDINAQRFQRHVHGYDSARILNGLYSLLTSMTG